MKRLGYTRYVAQGGDWGAAIVQAMGRQAPSGLSAIHTNLPATVRTKSAGTRRRTSAGRPDSDQERAAVETLKKFGGNGGLAYLEMMNARPQAVGYGQTDSPVGLAGWMLVHPGFDHWTYGKDPSSRRRGTMYSTTSACTG